MNADRASAPGARLGQFDLAIVGAGWAGLAAAVTACAGGRRVALIDAAPQAGGRARRQSLDLGFGTLILDNGQHLLMGAYQDTLSLLRTLGIPEQRVFERRRLVLKDTAGLHVSCTFLPAPVHLLWALLSAQGLDWGDRVAVARMMTNLRRDHWQVLANETVDAMLTRHAQPTRMRERLWAPLCISALNTPIETACAQTFSHVLRDTLGGPRAHSDFLLPKATLSDCLPDPAMKWLEDRGTQTLLRAPVRRIERLAHSTHAWRIYADDKVIESDRLILACGPSNILRLLQSLPESHRHATARQSAMASLDRAENALSQTIEDLSRLDFRPIATLWVAWPETQCRGWTHPLMLHRQSDRRRLADWLFDRGLHHGHRVGALVISLADELKPALEAGQALEHARHICEVYGLPVPSAARLVTDRRATFACHAGRPVPAQTTEGILPGLWLAGDFTEGGYPATLESAIRSGIRAGSLASQA